MTDSRQNPEDDRSPDHFLVDGVAPSVIGGGSGPDLDEVPPDPAGEYRPRPRSEPPTTPIPVQGNGPGGDGATGGRSWFAKVFRRGD